MLRWQFHAAFMHVTTGIFASDIFKTFFQNLKNMTEMHHREHKEGQQSQTKVMLSGVKREKDRQNDIKSQLVITK